MRKELPVLAAASVLLAGCFLFDAISGSPPAPAPKASPTPAASPTPEPAKKGSLRIRVAGPIAPDASPHTYRIRALEGFVGQVSFRLARGGEPAGERAVGRNEFREGVAEAVFGDLEIGSLEITATASDDAARVLGTGTRTAEVLAGETVEVALTLEPRTQEGSARLDLDTPLPSPSVSIVE